ncbi:DUF2938 domain-containing protein [Pseudoalteromonas lipolytica]|uniref:DUF2938 domain-containing protein n=1 Tax=Pseudoalteromonas lipolytica TaxID=570156 RepID=UPI00055FF948|nr:DUF2938 domain-containing protein [Pseudoalteromonas lipolytica]
MTFLQFIQAIVIGLIATLSIDIWSYFFKKCFNQTTLNFCFVGRWALTMASGQFKHVDIAASEAKERECVVGWILHYIIGALFSLFFVLLIGKEWMTSPLFLPACLFGLFSTVMPFFVMQPALGLGVMAVNTAKPNQARLKTLTTHLLFGVGLYLSAQFVLFI